MMRRMICGLAIAFVVSSSIVLLAQEENCRSLDADAGRRFLPDRVPMEMDVIPVDNKNFSAIQFPNKSRIAIAGLITSGMSDATQKKYQYVLIAETRLKLDRWNVPAGMVGLSFESEAKPDAPTRVLVMRDFSGSEIDRITLKLDPNSPAGTISLTPKGTTDFELRIGKYVIPGKQN
ncbi:MAG TPA: hypothetical protein VE398_03020 [Acidobacteriota bacterium]|nr:hypothetical protein [Acidobacteriota bacterium]